MQSMTEAEEGGEILKTDRVGRVLTPREKREEILDAYESSGMSGPEFARMVGVKYPTFAQWVRKWRKERRCCLH